MYNVSCKEECQNAVIMAQVIDHPAIADIAEKVFKIIHSILAEIENTKR